jgi:rod shape-determining protein MreC
VGKVVQVFPDSSQVLPINDQFSGVGAALKSSRLQGILKGAPNGATTLQYVMSDEKVEPGEEVITSGGDRIFPKGLPVGKVVSVEPGKDLFLNIRVVPAARLDQVEEVLVVTKILEREPDTKDLGPLRASDILAERLPTVPAKPEVDAAGNAKPGAGNATTAGATGAAATTAHPGAAGTPAANRPATGSSTAGAPKPNGAATAVHGAPSGTAATSPGVSKSPKPATASGTRPAGTGAKPLNGAGTATAPNTNGTAPAATPSPANGPTNREDTTPAPKQAKPAPQQTPSANPQQPSTPPAGEPPPQ